MAVSQPRANPNTPPIPQPAENVRNLAACVAALKAGMESLIGQRGDASNRAVTFNDLISFGVLTPGAVSSPRGSIDLGGSGTPGPPGPPGGGTTILSGSGLPSSALGEDGNYYVDTVGQDLYGPKGGGVWPLAVPGDSGGAGGGVEEAPIDGIAYGRRNTAWVDVLMATGDVVDGGNW